MNGFELSPKQVEILKQLHKRHKDRRAADKIKAIVLLGTGWSVQQVSEALLLDHDTLRSYVQKYKEGNIANVLSTNYKGSNSRLSDKQKNELEKHLSEFTYSDVKSIIAYVKKEYGVGYKLTRMREILRDLGFTYKKPKVVPGNTDPAEALNFLQRYEKIRRTKNPLYFMDGVHPQHNSRPAYGWIKKGKDKALPSNTGRQRLNINAAVNIDSYELIANTGDTVNAQSTIQLFKKILNKHSGEEKIYIVCDNAGYYRCTLVKEFLEQEGKKIEIIFLPAYSPFLNLIERVWKYFSRKILNNKYYATFSEFKNACLNFLNRKHKKAFKKILVEKFHFSGGNIDMLKPKFHPR